MALPTYGEGGHVTVAGHIYRAIRTFFIRDDNKVYDTKMQEIEITASLVPIASVDDTPVNMATTAPISSNWAYNYINDQEELDALRDLETAYNTAMENERYTSDRRGYEIR